MDPVVVLFLGACLLGLLTLLLPDPVKLGRRLAQRKPRAEVDPWAQWKAIKSNLDASRKKEHEDWQDDFNQLVRATCVHSYPSTSHNPTYFTCAKCKYEEPWEFVENGCGCHFTSDRRLDSPFPEYTVTFRHGNCVWHGIDYANFGKWSDRSNKPFKSVLASR